jgi:DNA-binding MarR family transcriptional regulator
MRSDEAGVSRAAAQDTVDQVISSWLAELPGVDAEVEAARMRLQRLGRYLEQILAKIASDLGMTLGDLEALSLLRRAGPPYQLTPRDLAEALAITSGKMTTRLGRLLQLGMIEQVTSDADGRSRPVRLTELGHRHWSEATAARIRIEQRMIGETLSASQRATLNTLLRRVLVRAEADLGRAPQRGELRAAEDPGRRPF